MFIAWVLVYNAGLILGGPSPNFTGVKGNITSLADRIKSFHKPPNSRHYFNRTRQVALNSRERVTIMSNRAPIALVYFFIRLQRILWVHTSSALYCVLYIYSSHLDVQPATNAAVVLVCLF